MTAPTNSFFNTNATRIEEILNKNIGMFLPTFSKVWQDTIVTSQGVGDSGLIGRDGLIIKTYSGGLTGVLEPGGPATDFTYYGDPSNTAIGSKIFTQGLSKTFPDATKGANQATYRLGCPLRTMQGNIMLTLGELQAEATPAFLGEVVVPKMEGFARHITQLLCNYWYLSQNSYYAITTLAGGSGTGWNKTLDTNTTLMVDTTYSNYAIDRLMVGMRVQFYDATGATVRTTATLTTAATAIFFVTAVDEISGKVYFKAVDGLALNGGSFADTDICVMASSKGSSTTPYAVSPYFTGIAGVNSWMKFGDSGGATDSAANCLLGDERVGTTSGFNSNINVNVHPEFKSLLYSNAGAPLTEHVLRKILRRFSSAKGKYGHYVDTLIASDGVWLAYEAQKIGRQYLDRTGRLSSLNSEGSEEGMTFDFDGRKYTGHTDTYVESNTVYGIRRGGNNWKRYVPPDPKGVTRFDKTQAWNPWRFVGAALNGTNSIQMPIMSVSAAPGNTLVTEGVGLPGMLRLQLMPDQVTGIKITNVAEDRIYGS